MQYAGTYPDTFLNFFLRKPALYLFLHVTLVHDIQKTQGVCTGTIILVREAVCLPYRAEIQQGGKYGRDIEMEMDKEACRFQY